MRVLIAVLSLLLSGLAVAQNLSDDPKLKIPVTYVARTVPVSTAVASLGKLVKAPIEVVSTSRDLKVSIFAENQPAYRIMQGMSDALAMEWKSDGSTWRLAPNKEWQQKLNAYREQDLWGLIKPVADFFSGKASTKPTDQEMEASRLYFRDRSSWYPILFGQPIAHPLRATRTGFGQTQFTKVLLVAYDASGGRLNYGTFGASSDESETASQKRTIAFRGYREAAAPVTEISKELANWATMPDEDEFLDSQPKKGAYYPSPIYFNKQISLDSHLEALFNATKACIVADAFRVPSSQQQPISGGTVRSWLGKLSSEANVDVKYSQKVISVRHRLFWRHREREIPESVLAILESRTNTVALSDYMRFVSALNLAQASNFSVKDHYLLKVDGSPLVMGLPAIAHLGRYPANTQARILAGDAFTVRSSTAELGEFLHAILVGILGRGQTVGPIGNQFGATLVAVGNGEWRFAIEPADVLDASGKMTSGLQFMFGFAPNNCVRYGVPLPTK